MPRGKSGRMRCSGILEFPPSASFRVRMMHFCLRILTSAGTSQTCLSGGYRESGSWRRSSQPGITHSTVQTGRRWTRQHGAFISFGVRSTKLRPPRSWNWRRGSAANISPGGSTLADNIDRIRNAAITSAETLTYNDFHWTNLALSRNVEPIRAVVFDYHLLGLGLRYSDCQKRIGLSWPGCCGCIPVCIR